MYRNVVAISLVITLLAIALHFAARGRRATPPVPPRDPLMRWLYTLLLLSTTVAAATAWLPLLTAQPAMRGWWLFIHVLVALVFIVCLTALVLFWTDHRPMAAENTARNHTFTCAQKTAFYLAAALGLVVILSMLLPMTPLLAVAQQDLLFVIHRYAALAFVLALIIHGYLWRLALRRRPAMR
jgi:hypothetical protein